MQIIASDHISLSNTNLRDHTNTRQTNFLSLDSTTGDVTVGIYTSDGLEDSPPET